MIKYIAIAAITASPSTPPTTLPAITAVWSVDDDVDAGAGAEVEGADDETDEVVNGVVDRVVEGLVEEANEGLADEDVMEGDDALERGDCEAC